MTNDEMTNMIHTTMPLCSTLGIAASEMRPDHTVLTLEWQPGLCTVNDVLHGGAIMVLADSAGAACAFANLPAGAVGTSTIESKTNFLGAVTDGTVVATSSPLHVGSTTIVIETEITNHGRLVAKVTQTQAVLRPRPTP